MTSPGAEASGLGMQRSFGPSQPETMGLAVGGFLCIFLSTFPVSSPLVEVGGTQQWVYLCVPLGTWL